MFHFLGFILIIFLAILLFGLTLIGSIIKTLFGFGKRSNTGYTRSTRQPHSSEEPKQQTTSTPPPSSHKKIFSKDEGEYVEYEEIKK